MSEESLGEIKRPVQVMGAVCVALYSSRYTVTLWAGFHR